MKTEERRVARELRAQGWSIKEIEHRLGVSRSSVSRWVRDVELEPEAREALAAKIRLGPIVAAERNAAAARAIRADHQAEGRRFAQERGADYAAGCALYWAEGSRERNVVKLTNSDPEMLAYFARFLRTQFVWLERLGLSRISLRASTINTYSKCTKKKRTNSSRTEPAR